MKKLLHLALTLIALCLPLGCGASSDPIDFFESNPSGSEGSDGSGGSSGFSGSNLRILLSDSPTDADQVFVTIVRVEAQRADTDGFIVLNDETREFDLLELQNDITAVLVDGEFPVGRYTAIRLILAEGPNVNPNVDVDADTAPHRIVIDETAHVLVIPSGSQTGLKLNNEFELSDDKITELTLDWNARTSIHQLGSKDRFIMRPRLTLLATVVSGSISGNVESADQDAALGTVIVSAQRDGHEVLSTATNSDGDYVLNPLREGTYTLVVTSKAFEHGIETGVVVLAEQDTPDHDFSLEPADTGSIAGLTLQDDESLIIELRHDGHFIGSTGPDPDTGEFVFEDVTVGTYDVTLVDGDLETANLEDVEVLDGEETGDLLLGVGAIDGQVTDSADDTAIENATVTVSQDGDEIATATTDADGNYRIAPLPPKTYDLTVEAAEFTTPDAEETVVEAGETTTADAALDAE